MLKEKWKQVTDFRQWKERRPFLEYAIIEWKGFRSEVPIMVENGWEFEILKNNATGRERLYMRHDGLKYVGRCNLDDYRIEVLNGGVKCYIMDFLTPEKTQRINPPKVRVENAKVIDMEYDDIPEVLTEIIRLQEENKPKRKTVKAEVIDFVKRLANGPV